MAKILLIEDDKQLCDLVSDWLVTEGHLVETVHDGLMASDLLRIGTFDVIVLDWDLPGKSGIEILQEFRCRGGVTPLIMLTAKSTILEKETGLDIGADDYLTKPFVVRELAARIRALLRRPSDVLPDILTAGDVELDTTKHALTKAGVAIHLQPKDFALLEFFMRNPNRIFSTDALLARVWATDSDATADAIRSSIKRIRAALDKGADETESIIKTVPRVGYSLKSR